MHITNAILDTINNIAFMDKYVTAKSLCMSMLIPMNVCTISVANFSKRAIAPHPYPNIDKYYNYTKYLQFVISIIKLGKDLDLVLVIIIPKLVST